MFKNPERIHHSSGFPSSELHNHTQSGSQHYGLHVCPCLAYDSHVTGKNSPEETNLYSQAALLLNSRSSLTSCLTQRKAVTLQASISPTLKWVPEKAMATHSSTLPWRIPWTEEPGGLQSMGSLRVGHNWATSLSFFTFMHWRKKWQPTPVFLPGESQGRGSLVGCRLWGRTESDTTEAT